MTSASTDRYTRLVGWLKVLFPLAALGLLSTLFMLARNIETETQIPFAEKEIQDRLRDQQLTGPFFSGTTASGDQISFSASKITMPEGAVGINQAEDISAELSLEGGGLLAITAQTGQFDIAKDKIALTGSVLIRTSNGYDLRSDMITGDMTALNLTSPGPINGTSPEGDLTAGSMTLTNRANGQGAQLVFTNGVKLVYSPKQAKE